MAETTLKKVRLYYLGGIKTTRTNQKISSGREIVSLPPKGDYLELPEHVAIDLERKHKYILPNGDTLSAFTRDARIAKRVRDGMTVEQAYAPVVTASDFSNEDLLKELKKRGIEVPENTKNSEEPKAKSTSKSKDKSSKAEDEPETDPLGL